LFINNIYYLSNGGDGEQGKWSDEGHGDDEQGKQNDGEEDDDDRLLVPLGLPHIRQLNGVL
jgi:hypothetical protein